MEEGVVVEESGLLERREEAQEGKEKLETWAWRQREGETRG